AKYPAGSGGRDGRIAGTVAYPSCSHGRADHWTTTGHWRLSRGVVPRRDGAISRFPRVLDSTSRAHPALLFTRTAASRVLRTRGRCTSKVSQRLDSRVTRYKFRHLHLKGHPENHSLCFECELGATLACKQCKARSGFRMLRTACTLSSGTS